MPTVELENLSLSYLSIGESSSPLVFLPGIMGNKKNLEHFVRKLLQKMPKASALIFDLRNHGESGKLAPFLVEACADDVVQALFRLNKQPLAVFGHSFGGKVALLIAHKLKYLPQVWLLDCAPGAAGQKPLSDTFTALNILQKLRQVKWPVKSRNDLVKELLSLNVPREIALWMTTNVKSDVLGYRLVFDPDHIEKMLNDFVQLDLWPKVTSVSEHTKIHLVAAEHGLRISASDKERFMQVEPEGFHWLKNSGHFLHVDNPEGLIDIICNNLVLSSCQ